MLNTYILIAIMAFCSVGIYFTVKEIMSLFLKNDTDTKITLEITGTPDAAEAAVRSVMYANPSSEIFLINKSGRRDVDTLLDILKKESPRIHIENP